MMDKMPQGLVPDILMAEVRGKMEEEDGRGLVPDILEKKIGLTKYQPDFFTLLLPDSFSLN